MKTEALYITGERRVEVRQVELLPPGPLEIQVRVVACGVCAWDAYLFKGQDAESGFPFRLGHEAVGVVEAVGPGVTRHSTGDKVFCIESKPQTQMAGRINIPEHLAGALPAHLEEQALVHYVAEPAVCVVNGFANIGHQPGDDVAVIGCGYMGLLNVQAFRASLTGRLVCFDIDGEKLELARRFGADACHRSDTPEGAEAARALAAAGGFDVVVECSGSEPGLQLATDLVRTGGILSNFAWHRARRSVDASPWHLRGLQIINTAPALDPFFFRHIDRTANLVRRGIFRQEELVTHVMDYRKAQELLTIAEQKADGYIKGVVTF